MASSTSGKCLAGIIENVEKNNSAGRKVVKNA